MNYKSMIDKMTKIVIEKNDKSWIVLGDNSKGKSELLKSIIGSKGEDVYFIDSVNRGFNLKNVNLTEQEITHNLSIIEIVQQRIDATNHNLVDSFGLNEHIERLFPLYSKKLYEILSEFLNISFEIIKGKMVKGIYLGNIALIDNNKVELSSGYQAIIRIFSELILYCDCLGGSDCIIIDEIDEFLSPRHSARILEFLKNAYPNITFIVSTHSSDLIASSKDCYMLTIESKNFGVLDSNDFTTLSNVNTLFNDLYLNNNNNYHSSIEDTLQRLFDLKIMNTWNTDEEHEFMNIIESDLTQTQKVIYKQIRNW